jgi:hypothetical protein
MPIWNSLKRELDRAGQAAQDALDEGRLRLEQHRAKQRAEAAAASLGFAVYRARAAGNELESERYSALAANLATAEAEVARIDAQLASLKTTPAAERGGGEWDGARAREADEKRGRQRRPLFLSDKPTRDVGGPTPYGLPSGAR